MTAEEIRTKFGTPPSATLVTWNPASDKWVERVAIWLCADEHEADALPCSEHLAKARAVRNELAPGMAPTKVQP